MGWRWVEVGVGGGGWRWDGGEGGWRWDGGEGVCGYVGTEKVEVGSSFTTGCQLCTFWHYWT